MATGGWAMLDHCSYGAMLSRWHIGEQAATTFGLKANLDSQWGEAEDNAVILVLSPTRLGLGEASYTTWDHGVPRGPIVYGTEGTLAMEPRGASQVVRLEHSRDQTRI